MLPRVIRQTISSFLRPVNYTYVFDSTDTYCRCVDANIQYANANADADGGAINDGKVPGSRQHVHVDTGWLTKQVTVYFGCERQNGMGKDIQIGSNRFRDDANSFGINNI
jgi:hypothetical protein